MSGQWIAPIDKLMIWHSNTWVKNEAKSARLTLRIYNDQLLITSDTKVLETFNMKNRIKGIYQEDILILIVSVSGQEIRKIKFQIKTNAEQCFQRMGQYFPVMHRSSEQSKNCIQSRYRNIGDVLKLATENKDNVTSLPFPPEYEDFIKLCLLDPTFPQVVRETEKILQQGILKK